MMQEPLGEEVKRKQGRDGAAALGAHQSRKMQQPSLRVVLMTYLAFISRSSGELPGVTIAMFTHCGSTAASRSTWASTKTQFADVY